MDCAIIKSVSKSAHKCVVRISTSFWRNKKGIYQKRSITYLRRKSVGYNCLEEDANSVDAGETIKLITNWNDVDDGVYEVVVINETRDIESGYIDGWEFKLIPVKNS